MPRRQRSARIRPLMNIKLIIAWLWISIPLGWGVHQSVKKSLPLFGIEASAPVNK